MCFPKQKKAEAKAATPAYVEPARTQQSGLAIKGYDGDGGTDAQGTAAQGDTDDMAIRRRRKSASAGLGL